MQVISTGEQREAEPSNRNEDEDETSVEMTNLEEQEQCDLFAAHVAKRHKCATKCGNLKNEQKNVCRRSIAGINVGLGSPL